MESFDYEQVKTKLSALGLVFDDFFKKLNEMNLKYSSQISKFTQSLKEYFIKLMKKQL